jgi:murein DD-endopeptidase MepM/ murein hydrolase activator NlpD
MLVLGVGLFLGVADSEGQSSSFRLRFPLQGFRHDTAPVNSIFDHHLNLKTGRVSDTDGTVTAFTGESVSTDKIALWGCYSGNAPFQVNGNYISATGSKNDLCYDGHPAYDYKVRGGIVLAAATGIVIDAHDGCPDNTHTEDKGCSKVAGNYILIDHENGYRTLYGHLKQESVKKSEILNKQVTAGTPIAITDNSKYSTRLEPNISR